uniref:PRORP domain-containing protein n=1 Tax=Toxocara canis TaxID=6265 RepID=A0A183VCQ9_TOXCA
LFASLLRSEREYPIFYSEAVLRLMASRARKTPSLAKVRFSASNAWSISEAVGISHEGICSACGHPLNQREELNEDEHWALHKALLSFLECGTKNFSSGSPAEVRALRNHVRALPKAEGGTKSLVVDTLNLIHGRSIEPFYKMLLALMEDFPRIMLITRPGSKNRFIRHLSPLNISVFVCNKLSEDDLFILLAALEMGPGCYVLTNDQFSDHRHRLGHDLVPLFDRWNESRVVRYFASTYRYKMPGRFTCFPHRAPDGFHIPVARVIAPSIYEHDWICVVKKHVSRRK